MGPAAVPTHFTGPAGAPTQLTGRKARPGKQTLPVSLAPVGKIKQWMRRAGCLESTRTPTQTGEKEDEAGYLEVAGPAEEQDDEEKDIIQASRPT